MSFLTASILFWQNGLRFKLNTGLFNGANVTDILDFTENLSNRHEMIKKYSDEEKAGGKITSGKSVTRLALVDWSNF